MLNVDECFIVLGLDTQLLVFACLCASGGKFPGVIIWSSLHEHIVHITLTDILWQAQQQEGQPSRSLLRLCICIKVYAQCWELYMCLPLCICTGICVKKLCEHTHMWDGGYAIQMTNYQLASHIRCPIHQKKDWHLTNSVTSCLVTSQLGD